MAVAPEGQGAERGAGAEPSGARGAGNLGLKLKLGALAVLAACALSYSAPQLFNFSQGPVELINYARLNAEKSKLQYVENQMMGTSGSRALALAQEAQILNSKINSYDTSAFLRSTPESSAALTAQGKQARVQALVAQEAIAPRPVMRAQAPVAAVAPQTQQSYPAQSWRHPAISTRRHPMPLDVTRQSEATAHSEAATLARNLAMAEHQHPAPVVIQSSIKRAQGPSGVQRPQLHEFHPTEPVAPHPQALRGMKPAPPPGYVALGVAMPGQNIPAGAKILPSSAMSKLASGGHWVASKAMAGMSKLRQSFNVPRVGAGVNILDEAEAADAGNSTDNNTEPTIGATGMTASELIAFANQQKMQAKFMLHDAKIERNGAYEELHAARDMIKRGWDKHLKAEDLEQESAAHMSNATSLMNSYKMQLSTAKAQDSDELAAQLGDMAEKFKAEAEEHHAEYEEAMAGEGDLKLEPYNASAAEEPAAEEPAAEEPAAE